MDEFIAGLISDFRTQFEYIERMYKGHRYDQAMAVQMDAVSVVAEGLAKFPNSRHDYDGFMSLFTDGRR